MLIAGLTALLALTASPMTSPASGAGPVSFVRVDYPVTQPESVAIANLDGKHGPDLVVTQPSSNAIGVMLNKGNGTFGPIHSQTTCTQTGTGPVSIGLGDITGPAGGIRGGDGKVDAIAACPPELVVFRGKGDGTFASPRRFNLGVAPLLGAFTSEMVKLVKLRVKGPRVPVFQWGYDAHGGRRLCATFDLNPTHLRCDSDVAVQGPMAIGRLNPGYKSELVVTGTTGQRMAGFGFSNGGWSDSTRAAGSSDIESAVMGDLNGDGHVDVLMGHLLNPAGSNPYRVADALSWHLWNHKHPVWGIAPNAVPHELASINGLDAIGIADFNGDKHNDIVAAGDYGRGVVHLGDGSGGFDAGHDIPLIGYGSPYTATRTTLAVRDLNCDHQPDLVVVDELDNAVMVLRNTTHKKANSFCQ